MVSPSRIYKIAVIYPDGTRGSALYAGCTKGSALETALAYLPKGTKIISAMLKDEWSEHAWDQ